MNNVTERAALNTHVDSAPEGMGALLEGTQPIVALQRGQVVEAVLMRKDSDGLLVSFGHKAEGVVPSREMRSLTPEALEALHEGSTVLVYVLQPDEEEGQAVFSLDKANAEKGWRMLEMNLETGAPVEATVIGYNKGGAVVEISGVQGFIPRSQLANVQRDSNGQVEDSALEGLVGEHLTLVILELDRRRSRAVFSEKAIVQAQRAKLRETLMGELKEGEIRKGKVGGISNFGAFVDLGGVDGLIHISELSWGHVRSPEDIVKPGDEIDVYVMKLDHENKRIALSLRRITNEPWDTVLDRYQIGQLVPGTITKLAEFGAFARIEDSVEGLIHLSELSERLIRHPKEVVSEGDLVTVKIIRIEPERRRLGLSLKQAEEDL